MMKRLNLDLFEIVYVAIAIATFAHSTTAFATFFEGHKPTDLIPVILWYMNGGLAAVAVDIGMWASSRALSKNRSLVLFVAFFVTAIASTYSQILYAIGNVQVLTYGAGVSSYWRDSLQGLLDARVVIVPFLLPTFAVIFTFARLNHSRKLEELETIRKQELDQQSREISLPNNNKLIVSNTPSELLLLECTLCNKILGQHKDDASRVRQAVRHSKRYHPEFTQVDALEKLFLYHGSEVTSKQDSDVMISE